MAAPLLVLRGGIELSDDPGQVLRHIGLNEHLVVDVATDEAERKAARFTLCSLSGQVRELFEMGGLLDAFTIHSSREEALARLG